MENYRNVLRCKIHRATVTQANLEYEGSITIPPELMEAAGLAEYEAVHVWNVTAGTRFETYAILGEPRSNDICVNGAAARLVQPGDKVIIAAFMLIPESKIAAYKPRLIFVDENNHFKESRPELAGPLLRAKIHAV
jgi:aspartate 1-decarboxylase